MGIFEQYPLAFFAACAICGAAGGAAYVAVRERIVRFLRG